MKMPIASRLLIGTLIACSAVARETTVPNEGLHSNTPRVHALIGATVFISPDQSVEDATIVLRDGLIESVNANSEIPDDARVWDFSDKVIYPGFIDAYTHYGMPAGLKPSKPRSPYAEGPPPPRSSAPSQPGPKYWNPLVTPERDSAYYFKAAAKDAEALSDIGFTAVATFPGHGIFRGQGTLVNANGKALNESALGLKIAQHISFDLSPRNRSVSADPYPTSLMGSMALVRQALYDAQWQADVSDAYKQNPIDFERPEENAALSELRPVISQNQFVVFNAQDELDYQRIHRIADEFSIDYAILGNGYEYRRAEILKGSGATLILPLSFPEAPYVQRYQQSLDLSLEQLQHWEFAPSNAAFLAKNDIPFCITTYTLQNPAKEFWSRIRNAVKRGLAEEDALAAITTNPAALYNVDDRLGSIESGKIANLTIATGNLFSDKNAKITHLWIDGDYVEKKPSRKATLTGEWTFEWNGIDGFETATITQSGPKSTLKVGDAKIPLSQFEKEIQFTIQENQLMSSEGDGIARLNAYIDGTQLTGSGRLANLNPFSWTANRIETSSAETDLNENDSSESENDVSDLVFDRYPAGAFGVQTGEAPESILIRNAAVWTSSDEGVLEGVDVLVRNGRFDRVAKNIRAPRGAIIIDAEGKHVTPGLIDCHSHMAMSRGVNESGSAISVEVRAADIINPVNINVYRQLAGGLTTANLLHGSANPMGGQSQVMCA